MFNAGRPPIVSGRSGDRPPRPGGGQQQPHHQRGLQTLVLSNNDHHPLVIEFEQDHTRVADITENVDQNERSRMKMLHRPASSGRLLETHFDSVSTETYTRSSSASALYSSAPAVTSNDKLLNHSFPGGGGGMLMGEHSPVGLQEAASPPGQYSPPGREAPYISSSVMLPASFQPVSAAAAGKEEAGFYQNVTARFRQAPTQMAASGIPPPAASNGFRPSLQAMGGYSRHSRDEQNRNSYSSRPGGGSADHLQHKSPKTQELEEFAAKFEGYQKQRSRRNLQQPTPMLDQLARESCSTGNFSWLPATQAEHHQLTALETNLLKLVQRNDSITRRSSATGSNNNTVSEDSSSGRESVTTVISNCSNETLKYTDRHSSCETLRFSENGDQFGPGGQVDNELEVEWRGGGDEAVKLSNSKTEAVTSDYCDQQQGGGGEDRYGDYINMSSHSQAWRQVEQGKRVLARSLSETTSNQGDRIAPADSPPAAAANSLAGTPRGERPPLGHISDKLSYLNEAAQRRHLYNPSHPDWSDYVPPEGALNGLNGDIGLPTSHGLLDRDGHSERPHRPVPNLLPGYDSSSSLNSRDGWKRREETLSRSTSEVTVRGQEEVGAVMDMRRNQASQLANSSSSYVDEKLLLNRISSGRRKPKLPTPPASPNISTVRHTSTPSPPPPPPSSDAEFIQNSEPLPPPPSVLGSRAGAAAKFMGGAAAATAAGGGITPEFLSRSRYTSESTTPGRGPLNNGSEYFGGGGQAGGYAHSGIVGGYMPSDSMNQPVRRSVPPPDSLYTGYPTGNGHVSAEKQFFEDGGSSQRSTPPNKYQSAGRQPASTPKRDSPATIAAKEAPGWQMFLGVRSSTVNFTSEEANKFRAARDSSKTRSLRRDSTRESVRDQDQAQQRTNFQSLENKGLMADERPKTRRDDIRDLGRIKAEEMKELRREESTKLRRTESRGRKRPENPNRSPETENINPNQKRPSVEERHNNGKVMGAGSVTPTSVAGSMFHRSNSDNKFLGKSISYEEKRVGNSEDDVTSHNSNEANSSNNKQHSLHLSRERSLKSISNWWKNSLEAGPPAPSSPGDWSNHTSSSSACSPQTVSPTSAVATHPPPVTANPSTPSPRHNHSHSDSGISSLSGRSSCMSPMSDLSSSSSGSSRTSLRSASIVSASNIPLETEEGEVVTSSELEFSDLCRDILIFSPQDSRLANAIRTCLLPGLSLYFAEASLEFEIRLNPVKEAPEAETPRRNQTSCLEESRKKLVNFVTRRLEAHRKNQQLLKESTKANSEFVAEVLVELGTLAQKPEFDKVKLFIEEIDKITSLIIGLSSRLLRTHLTIKTSQQVDKECLEKKEKLEEQLEEARKLRQSIFRRSTTVFHLLAKHLNKPAVDRFGEFVKEKIRLILETRQQTEAIKNEEEILRCLKEYTSSPTTGIMII